MKTTQTLLFCGATALLLAGCTMTPRPEPVAYAAPQTQPAAKPVVKKATAAKPASMAKKRSRKPATAQTATSTVPVSQPVPAVNTSGGSANGAGANSDGGPSADGW